MRAHRALLSNLVLVLVLGEVTSAAADAVGPEPFFCPPGTRPYSTHGGSGCAPERPEDCPEGYEPHVVDDVAYCGPPHATACPTGSRESSAGPDRPRCSLLRRCEEDADCGHASTCRPTGLCIDPSNLPDRDPRFASFRAYGECETDSDCEAGRVCDTSPRCDPDVHRVDPQGRTLPAIVRPLPLMASMWGWFLVGGAVVLGLLVAFGAILLRHRWGAGRDRSAS